MTSFAAVAVRQHEVRGRGAGHDGVGGGGDGGALVQPWPYDVTLGVTGPRH